MGSVDDTKWDVEKTCRPQRANRGNMLQELLDKGLESEEEQLLHDLSDATTDSTFTGSGEEAMDEIDSDFSDEEVEGVLDGTEAQTEEMLRREERQEKKKERQHALRHGGRPVTRRGGAVEETKAALLRLRPLPTIPLEERLQAAQKRALELRAEAAAASVVVEGRLEATVAVGASTYNMAASMAKRRRMGHNHRLRLSAEGRDEGSSEEDGEAVAQRICYTSSVKVLEQFSVPVVISFSKCLPPIFCTK